MLPRVEYSLYLEFLAIIEAQDKSENPIQSPCLLYLKIFILRIKNIYIIDNKNISLYPSILVIVVVASSTDS